MADSTEQTIENISYENSKVDVDGKTFVSCQFSNVTFAYSGGLPPTFVGCRLEGIVLQFGGKATDTLGFLTKMQQGGLSQSVQTILGSVRNAGRTVSV